MIVISQPRYLPALNYLQRLAFAERFILLDTVQRQARGWENRNQLLLPTPKWLTIPIASSSREVIARTEIEGCDWIAAHKAQIRQFHGACPHFDARWLDACYDGVAALADGRGRIDFTAAVQTMLVNLSALLGLRFRIVRASALVPESRCTGPHKLVELCRAVGGGNGDYISGPNGRDYGVDEAFAGSGIGVRYHDYVHPVYPQAGHGGAFTPYMAFWDALFNMGLPWLQAHLRQAPALCAADRTPLALS